MLVEKILNAGNYGKENEDREKISYYAGFAGLLSNVILSVLKVIIGIFTGSISVLADAVNNIMDSASSIITIVGVKLAHLPPDEEHPYGHGRIEYITALVVSSIVIVVGFQFVKSSYDRLVNPVPVAFRWTTLILLLLSMAVKFYQSRFNKKVGDAINSAPLKATATDSLGDVLVTGVVLLSLLLDRITDFPVDGLVGIGVSLFIIYSGLGLTKETISTLIGEAPSYDFFETVHDKVCEYPHVVNVHDIITASYGPDDTIVVLDAEFPYDMSLEEVHEIVDQAEREISREMGIHLVIHMDPVGNESGNEQKAGKILNNWIASMEGLSSYHDLKISEEGTLLVDITADGNIYRKKEDREKIRILGTKILQTHFPDKDVEVNIDVRY